MAASGALIRPVSAPSRSAVTAPAGRLRWRRRDGAGPSRIQVQSVAPSGPSTSRGVDAPVRGAAPRPATGRHTRCRGTARPGRAASRRCARPGLRADHQRATASAAPRRRARGRARACGAAAGCPGVGGARWAPVHLVETGGPGCPACTLLPSPRSSRAWSGWPNSTLPGVSTRSPRRRPCRRSAGRRPAHRTTRAHRPDQRVDGPSAATRWSATTRRTSAFSGLSYCRGQ